MKLKGKVTRGRKYGELKKRRQGRNEGRDGEIARERRKEKEGRRSTSVNS